MLSVKEPRKDKKPQATRRATAGVPARTLPRRSASARGGSRDIRISYRLPGPAQDGIKGAAAQSVAPPGAGRKPTKLVCVDQTWYLARPPQSVQDTAPVTLVPDLPYKQTGDTYEPETGKYVSWLQNLSDLFDKINKARRKVHHIPPRNLQEHFAQISMNGYSRKAPLTLPTLSGRRRLAFVKSYVKQAGAPRDRAEFQPLLLRLEGRSTRYRPLAATLADRLHAGKQLDLSRALLKYAQSLPDRICTDPTLFSEEEQDAQIAADLLSGLILAENHFTRALDDGGKTMRAAVRLMGTLGPQRVFGLANAIMIICREHGNATLRDLQGLLAWYKALPRRIEDRKAPPLSEKDLQTLEKTEYAFRDAGEDLAVLNEFVSDSSQGEC